MYCLVLKVKKVYFWQFSPRGKHRYCQDNEPTDGQEESQFVFFKLLLVQRIHQHSADLPVNRLRSLLSPSILTRMAIH